MILYLTLKIIFYILNKLFDLKKMQILGVTGGIGSGKSTYCETFHALGIPVIDADKLSRDALKPGEQGYFKVRQLFEPLLGPALLLEPGASHQIVNKDLPEIDRVKLGEFIFKNESCKKQLEAIIHPYVRRQMIYLLCKYFVLGYQRVILEVPLLFETGWDKFCTKTLVIYW